MFLNPNISSGESEVIIQDHKIATAATSHEIIRTLDKRGATIGQNLL
jgi:uracil phosphoribosyltransferase